MFLLFDFRFDSPSAWLPYLFAATILVGIVNRLCRTAEKRDQTKREQYFAALRHGTLSPEDYAKYETLSRELDEIDKSVLVDRHPEAAVKGLHKLLVAGTSALFLLLLAAVIVFFFILKFLEGESVKDLASVKRTVAQILTAKDNDGTRDGKRVSIANMQAVVSTTPTFEAAYYLATLQEESGDHIGSISSLQTAEKCLGKKAPETQSAIALSYIGLGDYHKARTILSDALALARNASATSNMYFIIHVNLAKSYLEEARIFPSTRAALLLKAQDEYVECNKYRKDASLKQIAALESNFGASKIILRDAAGAAAHFSSELQIEQRLLSDSYVYALYNVGVSLSVNRAHFDAALGALKQAELLLALKKDPLVGAAYLAEGNIWSARSSFEKDPKKANGFAARAKECFQRANRLASVEQTRNDAVMARAQTYLRRFH